MGVRIIISDLHLTDSPDDEYRWGLFPWLIDKIGNMGAGVKDLFILGDLTDKKDRHAAKLVNRVVNNIVDLYQKSGLHGVTILRGNHDGLDDVAYFEFLRRFPFVEYVTKPTEKKAGFAKILMLPHTKSPDKDWALFDLNTYKHIYMHHTFAGAKTESGYTMEGEDNGGFIKNVDARIISGDIHVPQSLGRIEYVGAPYPIRFGDSFKGRVLLEGDSLTKEWYYPTIKKVKRVIRGMKGLKVLGLGLRTGDQAKFEMELPREEIHEFKKAKTAIKDWCDSHGVILYGVELKQQQKLRLKGKDNAALTEKLLSNIEAIESYGKRTEAQKTTIKVGERLFRKANPLESRLSVERTEDRIGDRNPKGSKRLRIGSKRSA